MVGAGINIVPFALQRTVPGVGDWVLVAYALAAVPAVLAALCYAMLGSAMPRAGGSYVYASRAIGPYAGFLASFSQWFGLCIAIGVVSYVIPPFLRDIAAAAQWTTVAAALDQRPLRLGLALAFLWTFVFVNLRGVRAVANTLLPLMLIMFVCGGLVIVTGFSHSPAEYVELLASQQRALPPEPARASFWLVVPPAAAILFSSFIGFDAIAQAGGEAKNPSRSIPLAIGLTIAIVGAFYFLFTAAVYHTVPWWHVAAESHVRDVTAPGLLSPLTSPIVAIIMVSGAAVSLINDLEANAYGAAALPDADFETLQKGTTDPEGSTSIFSRPPAMSLTFLAKSLAYSWKMSLAGQVLWKRSEVVCAIAMCGATMAPAPTAPAVADFRNWRRGAGSCLVASVMACLRWSSGAAHADVSQLVAVST